MTTTPKVLSYEEWLALPETEGLEEVVQAEIRKLCFSGLRFDEIR